MKFKSLIVAALCAASVICAADVTYTGKPAMDLKQYINANPNKIKTCADVKAWYTEYKSAFSKNNFNPFTEVKLYYLYAVKNGVQEYKTAVAELENIAKTTGKDNNYWIIKYYLVENGKQYLSAQEAFEQRMECIINGVFDSKSLLRMSTRIMKDDVNVDKNVKIKAYKQAFEKYYPGLANENRPNYKDLKMFLLKIGLKLKSLGVEVK